MLVLEHMRRLVDACYPKDNAERLRLWHDIKPAKFGNRTQWNGGVAGNYVLADYTIPEDASYLAILRVECYVVTFYSTAPDFQLHAPPPQETTGAFWQYFIATGAPGGLSYNLTPTVPIHLLCDVDDLLMAKGGHRIQLVATLTARLTAASRFIRTTVYAYNLGSLIADKIGGGEPHTIGTFV